MSRHSNIDDIMDDLLGASKSQLRRWNENNIAQDRYDNTLYAELLNASSELARLEEAAPLGTWSALLRDIWAGFYKASPELVPEEDLNPPYRANRPFVERFLEDKTTAEARITTMLDELSSAVATITTGQKLLEEINRREELKQALNQAAKARQAEIDGAPEIANELANQARQALQEAAREIRRTVRQAVQAGRDEANQLRSALAGWGLEPGDLSRGPLSDRLKLAECLLVPRFRKLADLVGRFRNLARTRQKEKLKKDRDELYGITIGADLSRILPAELAALDHPLRRLDFYRRFTERQLLQYELKARKPVGRGPMIVLVDCSGSMGGEPLDWAIAVLLGLFDTATRQKRSMVAIFFDTRIVQEIECKPGEKDPEKLMAMATIIVGGGTDYTPALSRAIELIAQDRYQKADVVMITDGICRLREPFLQHLFEEKRTKKFRIWSVLIGSHDPYGELSKWSDRVWPISELTDDTATNTAGDIFEEVY